MPAHGSGAPAGNRTGLWLAGSSYLKGIFHALKGTGAALLFIRPQRAQVRTWSSGWSGSRTSHSDQSCTPTRQAILPHMWSPHVDRRARHRNSTAMCVILHYPALRPDGTSAATALLASATAFEMVSPGVVSVGAASSWTSASAEVASPRVRLRNSMNSSNWSRTPTSTPSGCSARTSQPRLVI